MFIVYVHLELGTVNDFRTATPRAPVADEYAVVVDTRVVEVLELFDGVGSRGGHVVERRVEVAAVQM